MEIVNRSIHLDLGNVRYSITGESSNLIVLMHGLTTSKDIFDELTEKLVNEGFQVLAFDFYGRGESDHIQPVESELIYAEQAVELIENFIPYGKKRKMHILGYSAGGAIASRVAAIMGQYASSLTLIASSGIPSIPRSETLVKTLEKVYRNDEIDKKMINEVKKLMFEEIELIENKDMKNKLQDIMNNDDFLNHDMIQTIRAHINATGGYVGEHSINEVFEEINEQKIPTLIMTGLNDNWINPECGREIKKIIESAQLLEYEGVSHWAFLEKPNLYFKDIKKFLDTTE